MSPFVSPRSVVQTISTMDLTPTVPKGADDFPQELVDDIVGYLQDSTKDLCACSLVCRVWEAAASRYLFKVLRVRKSRMQALLPLLESSERISGAVMDITLGCDHAMFQLPQDESNPDLSERGSLLTYSLEDILTIIARLPLLRSMDIFGINPKYEPRHNSLGHIRGMHLNLEWLSMIDLWNFLHDPSSIHLFFSAFDKIGCLFFKLTREYPIPTNVSTFVPEDHVIPRPVTIRYLTLSCRVSLPVSLVGDMAEVICEPANVTGLQLDGYIPDYIGTLSLYNRLISRFRNLEELHLYVPVLIWSLRVFTKGFPGMYQSHISYELVLTTHEQITSTRNPCFYRTCRYINAFAWCISPTSTTVMMSKNFLNWKT